MRTDKRDELFETCIYKEIEYKHLSNFSDSCNTCSCFNGKVSCSNEICNDKSSVCGLRNINGIGPKLNFKDGPVREAQFGEWPHMCTLLKKQKANDQEHFVYLSGASLIAPNVVLTAAHYVQ